MGECQRNRLNNNFRWGSGEPFPGSRLGDHFPSTGGQSSGNNTKSLQQRTQSAQLSPHHPSDQLWRSNILQIHHKRASFSDLFGRTVSICERNLLSFLACHPESVKCKPSREESNRYKYINIEAISGQNHSFTQALHLNSPFSH